MKRSTRLLSMLHFLPSGVFLHLAYLNETGHVLYLKNPRRFNEKLNFIKLRGGAEGWSRFVDKLEVREHVRRMVGETHLVPLIAQYDSVGEIDWTALPERFVIKCSHGSHCGLICTDKTNFDTAMQKPDFGRGCTGTGIGSDGKRPIRRFDRASW